MKLALVLVALLPFLPIRADDTAANGPITEFAKFCSQRQVLIIRGYSDLGGIQTAKGNKIDVRILEASANNKKAYAVDVNGSQIDLDEIASLLAAINSILKLDKTASKLDDFGADYGTRSGLYVSKYSNPDGTPILSFGEGTVTEVSPKELAEIRDLIAQAQAKLKALQ
jgi:hypothetical protein